MPQSAWSYLSLSELSVVIKLIRTRSLVDTYYVAQRYSNPRCPLANSGVVRFDEDILTTYFDLDALISECGLTPREHRLVTMLMDGYTVRDFVLEGQEWKEEYGEKAKDVPGKKRPYLRATEVFRELETAARKVVDRNNARWAEANGINGTNRTNGTNGTWKA